MNDLKNQIFALLKKRPYWARPLRIHYYKDLVSYDVTLHKKLGEQEDVPGYSAYFVISTDAGMYDKNIELTEKEFMDMKWTIDEWHRTLEAKAFEEFRDFVESEPNSMDDLLKDE